MSSSFVVNVDYERVNGGADVCRRTCEHRHQFRDWLLGWQRTGHECSHFGVRLETFRDGNELKCRRATECIDMEKNCEQFDDVPQAPIARASDPDDWASYNRNVRQLPRAVERPTSVLRGSKV